VYIRYACVGNDESDAAEAQGRRSIGNEFGITKTWSTDKIILYNRLSRHSDTRWENQLISCIKLVVWPFVGALLLAGRRLSAAGVVVVEK